MWEPNFTQPSICFYLGMLRVQALAQLISITLMGRRLVVALRSQTRKGQPWGRNSIQYFGHLMRRVDSLDLGRKPPRVPQLEETPEMPPSSRDEGLLFLPGLESNHESSLKSEEEAGLP